MSTFRRGLLATEIEFVPKYLLDSTGGIFFELAHEYGMTPRHLRRILASSRNTHDPFPGSLYHACICLKERIFRAVRAESLRRCLLKHQIAFRSTVAAAHEGREIPCEMVVCGVAMH